MTMRRAHSRACWRVAVADAGRRRLPLGPGRPRAAAASLTVTRDYGAKVLARASEKDLPGGETVMRLLQRNADVETRYGGRFVNAIDGVRSSQRPAARRDWFYYVNGIEADVGAAEKRLHDGDRVWWDYHDWTRGDARPGGRGLVPGAVRARAGRQALPGPDRLRRRTRRTPAATCADRLDAAGITRQHDRASARRRARRC